MKGQRDSSLISREMNMGANNANMDDDNGGDDHDDNYSIRLWLKIIQIQTYV